MNLSAISLLLLQEFHYCLPAPAFARSQLSEFHESALLICAKSRASFCRIHFLTHILFDFDCQSDLLPAISHREAVVGAFAFSDAHSIPAILDQHRRTFVFFWDSRIPAVETMIAATL
jgi:hypothetical protein